jgi:DNA-binding IclR family transcriptional regulator
MSEKISARDEQKVLSVLDLGASGMTLDEVERNTELGSMKLFAILEALVRKGHIRQREMKYFLKKPLEFFKEPEE